MATALAPPDAELIARMQQRDRSAWKQLYRLYEGRLYEFAYRLTDDAHDAADLVQEAFLRALPRLDHLDPAGLSLSSYLFTTAGKIFLIDLEGEMRAGPGDRVSAGEESLPPPRYTDQNALPERQLHAVRLANARLAPRQRLVLALRELADQSYGQIGGLTDLSANVVAQLIWRARESLCEELRLGRVDAPALPDECRRLIPLLSAHLDGQLTASGRAQVLAHLADCPHCRSTLDELREASRLYRQPVPAVAVGLFPRVDKALADSGYWRRPPGRRTRRRLHRTRRFVGVAAGVALVALVVGVVGVYPLVDTPDWPKLAAQPQARPALADLVIAGLTRSSVRVANMGKAAAGPFTVTVTGGGRFSFSGLGAGESATRSWSKCVAGTITAAADPTNQVAESHEQNNSRSIKTSC